MILIAGAGIGGLTAALREYERRRHSPTAAIVHSNRKQGPEAVMQIVEARA